VLIARAVRGEMGCLRVRRRNFLTGRIEVVDKDELAVPGVYRVQSYTAGYTRDFGNLNHVETGIGGTACVIPTALEAAYGDRPWGVNAYARVRLK
jgi:hypothetical protein